MSEVKLRTKHPEFFFDDANTEPAGWMTLTPVGIAHIRLYINQVERENLEARRLLEQIVEQPHLWTNENTEMYCFFCEAGPYLTESGDVTHKPGCVWSAIRAFLGEES